MSAKKIYSIKEIKGVLKQLNFETNQINSMVSEYEDLIDWVPITVRELQSMTKKELSQLKSYCWHDGKPRCDSIGIIDVVIDNKGNYIDISYSDFNGDPSFDVQSLDDLIDNVGDSEWNYGLYKKFKK